ncbi:MAG: D-alanine--D-alanine ligase family protein [Pseudomonadota bacterium]
MSERLAIALVFGGRSAEHEVSVRSSRSVFDAADRSKYFIRPVHITREGAWYIRPSADSAFDTSQPLHRKDRVVLSHDPQHRGLIRIEGDGRGEIIPVDLVFPVLHGPYGEDGTIQGLLEMADIPYVGCGVLASALGMDKVLMKGAFLEAGLQVSPFFWFLRSKWSGNRKPLMEKLKSSCFPVFVKPANMGSSVGITRVGDPSGFAAAVEIAARYDRKILVEDGVAGRELEVGVLGNDEPAASIPGEVISHSQYYDYEEKYLKDTAELIIPAKLEDREMAQAQEVAVKAFKAVDGSGIARVDMFLTPEGRCVVNEINTLPGFTSISMYPKLWDATGVPYGRLIDKLVQLAMERHEDKQRNITDRS